MSNIYKLAQELEVISTSGFTKRRVGREEDGGYVILDEIAKGCEVLYSYGVSDDWSFEEDFTEKYNCLARLYDHTIEPIITDSPKISFKKQGLGTFPTGHLDTLSNHIGENGDLQKRSILKMDIEWNEWDFLSGIDGSLLNNFDLLILEFHIIPAEYKGSHTPYFTEFHKDIYAKFNDEIFGKYLSGVRKIKESFCLYHVHVNNSLGIGEYEGCSLPYLLEVGFVNKKFLNSDIEITKEIFPIPELDFPNKPYKSEIVNFYPFIK
jgi:hypothetical protein